MEETSSRSKRKSRLNSIEASPDEVAILVSYDIIESGHTENKLKRIRLKTLCSETDVPSLAQEIMKKYSIIPPSKISLLEAIIYDFQRQRAKSSSSSSSSRTSKEKNSSSRKNSLESTVSIKKKEDQERAAEPPAFMKELDTYMEKLYDDDMDSKIEGASRIRKLSEYIENIEEMVQNESLLGLLSRVLNEEYKKSYEFVYNIIQIFWNFSNYSELHHILSNYRIGAITMKIIDFEIKRHKLRMEEESALQSMVDAYKHESKENAKKLLKEQEKNKSRLKKQDKLFLLLNLAEDIHTERKMVKKKIVPFLVEMLDRQSTRLVILTMTFLKKLSIFEENKDLMANMNVVESLIRLTKCTSDKLVQTGMKLIFNFSFDPALRDLMVKNSLIPKLVDLLKKPPFRALSLRILYHMSIDDRCKSMFTYTEAIPLVMKLVINFPQNMVAKELVALAINLSLNGRNAELMCQNKGLESLITRIFRTRDPLLIKCVRNISQWSHGIQEDLASERLYKYRGMWAPYVVPFLEICQSTDNHDFSIEILGILSNVTPLDLDKYSWAKIVNEQSVIPFLHKLLVPGFSQDDMILEVICFVSTLALDPKCASLLTSSRIIRIFHSLLQEKQHDEEICLQLLFCFYRMLRHPETLDEVLYGSGILPDVLILADSANTEVRRMCDMVMDLILDHDLNDGEVGEFGRQIRQRRFEIHNSEYLKMMRHSGISSDDEEGKHRSGDDEHFGYNSNEGVGDHPDGDDGDWVMRHRGEHIAMDMEAVDDADAEWNAYRHEQM